MIYIEECEENSGKNDLTEEDKPSIKNECLLQAVKDFSKRYDNDNRHILKNKKFLVNFSDLMTLIKETIDFQNKIISLCASEIDKLKDIAQDFINNLSYTIFSFEKIDISNKDIFNEKASESNDSKLNYKKKICSTNSKYIKSNSNLNSNILVNRKQSHIQITKQLNNNLNNRSYTKINRNNINIISVNNNQTSNEIIRNKSADKKKIIRINTVNNYTNKFTENNNFLTNTNKSTTKTKNNLFDIPHITENNNQMSSSIRDFLIGSDSAKITNNINNYSSLVISIPHQKKKFPKKICLIQNNKKFSRKNSHSRVNLKQNSFKEKKIIKTKTNNKIITLTNLNHTRNKHIDETKKHFKTNFRNLNDNNQYLYHNTTEIINKQEKINENDISKKEKKSNKGDLKDGKDNSERKFIHKQLIGTMPTSLNMTTKMLENRRKFFNGFNEKKKEEEENKKKK